MPGSTDWIQSVEVWDQWCEGAADLQTTSGPSSCLEAVEGSRNWHHEQADEAAEARAHSFFYAAAVESVLSNGTLYDSAPITTIKQREESIARS